MKLIEIKIREKYNNFIIAQKQAQFLQSWEWGEFQESAGNKILRFGIKDGDKLLVVFTVIEKRLALGMRYWYSPRIDLQLQIKDYELFFDELKKIAKENKIIFFRFDPLSQFKIQNSKFKIERTLDVQPKKTLILDISKPEKELLKDMHQKTRYNIRLAKRKGVVVTEASDNDFEEWWGIIQETSQRDGFRLHQKDYYKKQLQIKNKELQIKLIVAKYKDKIIAGNIVSFFGDMATYVHGASSSENRNVMAPYLLQWCSIQEAKRKGCKYYDFYGIDEKKWPGVTRFKKGFSGEEINYPGTFDLIFSKTWYNVYKLIRRLRRLI